MNNGLLFWFAGWLFTLGTLGSGLPEFLKGQGFWDSVQLAIYWPLYLGAYFAG